LGEPQIQNRQRENYPSVDALGVKKKSAIRLSLYRKKSENYCLPEKDNHFKEKDAAPS